MFTGYNNNKAYHNYLGMLHESCSTIPLYLAISAIFISYYRVQTQVSSISWEYRKSWHYIWIIIWALMPMAAPFSLTFMTRICLTNYFLWIKLLFTWPFWMPCLPHLKLLVKKKKKSVVEEHSDVMLWALISTNSFMLWLLFSGHLIYVEGEYPQTQGGKVSQAEMVRPSLVLWDKKFLCRLVVNDIVIWTWGSLLPFGTEALFCPLKPLTSIYKI